MEFDVFQQILPFLGIAGAVAVGTVSPGPSFIMVARTSVSSSCSAGLAAALGMGIGGAFFAVAAFLGLKSVLLALPTLYLGFKIVGGLYLLVLGYRIWQNASKPISAASDLESKNDSFGPRAFLLGLGTQISNPKTAVVYASVFAAFLPQRYPFFLGVLTVLIIFMIETGWYSVVALTLSSGKTRSAYLRWKPWIDRFAGSCMIFLGLKLAISFRTL
jgi:threonine/homoserine/homoserine lactone efflux protein